jgi:hypothetical protein
MRITYDLWVADERVATSIHGSMLAATIEDIAAEHQVTVLGMQQITTVEGTSLAGSITPVAALGSARVAMIR